MRLTVQRRWLTGESTIGELLLDGVFECNTLELPVRDGKPGSAIPAGIYTLCLDHSPRFGRLMPELFGIPGRSTILIHWGNTAANTDGCILVGRATGQPNWIADSRATFNRLLGKLWPQLVQATHQIEVVDAEPPAEMGVEEATQ